MADPRTHAALTVVACGLAVGVSWCLAVALVSRAPNVAAASMLGGIIAIAAAGAVLLALGAWAARDPVAHQCPVCQGSVSRWTFRGVYLPPEHAEGAPAGKAHAACWRCLYCRARLAPAAERWAAGPLHRPYHAACWAAHCAQVCAFRPPLVALGPSSVSLQQPSVSVSDSRRLLSNRRRLHSNRRPLPVNRRQSSRTAELGLIRASSFVFLLLFCCQGLPCALLLLGVHYAQGPLNGSHRGTLKG